MAIGQRRRYILELFVLFALYFISGEIGVSLGQYGSISCIWPASGIALAALFLYGYRLWPAIFAAVFLISLTIGHPLIVAAGSGLANVAEIVIAVYLLKKSDFDYRLNTARSVAILVTVGLLSSVIGATIGIYSQVIGGLISPEQYIATWGPWYLADVLGILVFAPLILVWVGALHSGFRLSSHSLPDILLAYVALVLLSILSFSGIMWPAFVPGASAYIVIPPLLWISFRFHQPGTVIGIFLLSAVAVLSTILIFPHEPDMDLDRSLFLLQRFLGIASITLLMMGAVIEERTFAQEKQLELVKRTVQLKGEQLLLKRIGRTKDEFIAVASHQLRTPATVVKMHLGMLRDGLFGKLTDAQINSVTNAYQANERLIDLINDLLGVAQVDMDNVRLQKEQTDMQRLVTRVIYHIDPTIAERQQTISFVHDEKSHIAKVDQGKFAMVIENLIDNASKYSDPGKKIVVGLFTKGRDELDIEVRDEGVGISRKDLGKLFKKFSRIENALSKERGGTGLGLYWVKKIVALHGGKITVSSAPGKGTIFTIRLKCEKSIFA